MRQALFDMLAHAPWAAGCLVGADVLDVFAGTGALGLEALSRGAARAHFIERDRAALVALRANVAACKAGDRAVVLAVDAQRALRGTPCSLVFLDPPYGLGLVPSALTALNAAGWIAPGALIVAETAADEVLELPATCVAERSHGAARTSFWRWGAA
jgi:16S rRNA (guanine966-N2)-methyltransferase